MFLRVPWEAFHSTLDVLDRNVPEQSGISGGTRTLGSQGCFCSSDRRSAGWPEAAMFLSACSCDGTSNVIYQDAVRENRNLNSGNVFFKFTGVRCRGGPIRLKD